MAVTEPDELVSPTHRPEGRRRAERRRHAPARGRARRPLAAGGVGLFVVAAVAGVPLLLDVTGPSTPRRGQVDVAPALGPEGQRHRPPAVPSLAALADLAVLTASTPTAPPPVAGPPAQPPAPASTSAGAPASPAVGGPGAHRQAVVPALSRRLLSRAERVDLSRLGAQDWVHWGARGDPRRVERAATGSGLPHRYRQVASGPLGAFTGNGVSYAWHDGAPNRSEDGTTTGLYVEGPGRGFRLTVPLPSAPSTLELYVGSSRGPARLTARVSGGDVRSDTFPGRPDGTRNVVYRLRLLPRPGGGSVQITWTGTGDDPSAGVTLQSMVLLAG